VLTGVRGVQIRARVLRMPFAGFNFELTEFSNFDRKPDRHR
jgi:hypothetical protein